MSAPQKIGDFTVIEYASFLHAILPLGYIPPNNGRPPLDPVQNLAICKAAGVDGFYLLYCTSEWKHVTYSFHETIELTKMDPLVEFGQAVNQWIAA